jgi:hypothetical protein
MNPQSFSAYFYGDKFGLGFCIIVQELGVIIHSMIIASPKKEGEVILP